MPIYGNVKRMCNKNGISVYALENAVGFPRSSICKWDVNTPGIDKVKTVADYFGCTVDDLITDRPEEQEVV